MQVEPMDFCDKRRAFLRPLDISVYKLGAQDCSPKKSTSRVQNSVHLIDIPVIHSASIGRVLLCVCLCVWVCAVTQLCPTMCQAPWALDPLVSGWWWCHSGMLQRCQVMRNVSWATQLLFGEANEVGPKAQTGTATSNQMKQVGTGKATG